MGEKKRKRKKAMSNKGLTFKEGLSDHKLGLAGVALCHRNLLAIASEHYWERAWRRASGENSTAVAGRRVCTHVDGKVTAKGEGRLFIAKLKYRGVFCILKEVWARNADVEEETSPKFRDPNTSTHLQFLPFVWNGKLRGLVGIDSKCTRGTRC